MGNIAFLKVHVVARWSEKVRTFWDGFGSEGLMLFCVIGVGFLVLGIPVGYALFLIWPAVVLALVTISLWRGFRRNSWLILGGAAFLVLSWYFYHIWAWDGVLSVLLGIAGIILWIWAPYQHNPKPPPDPISFMQS